jgi:hypothetical protein
VELQKAKELAPGSFHPLTYLGRLYAEMGDKERVNAILKEMEQRSKKGHVPRHSIAWFYNWLGQDRKALDLLERSLEEREIFLRNNVTDKGWDNLRSEPRFRNILRQLNLDN